MSAGDRWQWLEGSSAAASMTMEEYLALPEDLARSIEVLGGLILHCESPSESHLGIQQNLAFALQGAIDKHDRDTGSCYRVRMEQDLLLEDSPTFSFRRPDLTVYRCLPKERRRSLWAKPRAEDAVLGIEIVSAQSRSVDLLEKRARSAAAGIPAHWIVQMAGDDGPAVSVERLKLTVDGLHVSEGVALRDASLRAVDVIDPLPVSIPWEDLDRGLT